MPDRNGVSLYVDTAGKRKSGKPLLCYLQTIKPKCAIGVCMAEM